MHPARPTQDRRTIADAIHVFSIFGADSPRRPCDVKCAQLQQQQDCASWPEAEAARTIARITTEAPAAAGEAPKKAKKAKEVPQVKILQTWDVPDDTIGDYDYPVDKVENFTGNKVDLLGQSAEEGKPEGRADWRQKFEDREQMIQYLKTGLRYWYSKDVFGSEKRKTPA